MSVTVKGPDERRSGGRGPSTTLIALVAALTVAIVAIAWLLADRRHDDDARAGSASAELTALRAEQSAAREAVAEAKTFLTAATTYSWRDGEHDFAWLDQLSNEEVRTGIEQAVDGLRASVVEQKLTAQGEVIDAAPRVVDSSRVEVLAFVDQLLARADDDQVSIDQMRIVVTMQHTDDGWMVDDLVFQSGGLGEPDDEGALD